MTASAWWSGCARPILTSGINGHGDARPSAALEAIRRGAYDYILKPFEKDNLYLGVRRALEHRRLLLENRNYQRNLEKLVEDRTGS